MKTIKDSGQLMISVRSAKTPEVKPGTIQVTTVQYRTYEYPVKEFDDNLTFQVHDANLPEAKTIAHLVAL